MTKEPQGETLTEVAHFVAETPVGLFEPQLRLTFSGGTTMTFNPTEEHQLYNTKREAARTAKLHAGPYITRLAANNDKHHRRLQMQTPTRG